MGSSRVTGDTEPAPRVDPQRIDEQNRNASPTAITDEKFRGVDESHVLKVSILVNRSDGWLEFPLWLKTGVDAMPDFAVVESATIEWGPTIIGRMSVQLKMDYQMGRWFLDSELSRVVNALTVQAGYPKANHWTPIFYGYLQAPQVSHDPTGYAITLQANVIGQRLLRMRYDMSKFIRGSGQRKGGKILKTRRDVLRDFLESQGFGVYFLYDNATQLEEQNAWLDDTADGWWPEEQDITGFVQWVCMEAGMRCVMWPHPDSGVVYAFTFMNRATIYKQEIAKELVLFGEVNLPRGRYPLQTFASDSPAVFWDRWSMGAVASDIDPDTNEETEYVADETTIKSAALEDESIITRSKSDAQDSQQAQATEQDLKELALEALESEAQLNFVSVADERRKLAYEASREEAPGGVQVAAMIGRDGTEEGRLQSVYEEKAMASGVRAQLQTIGMPDAFPEMLVKVSRVGSRWDGKYRVHKVTHQIGTVWDTGLEVIKSDFSKGSGMLESDRPVLTREEVGSLYPGLQDMPTEIAGGSGGGDVVGEEVE